MKILMISLFIPFMFIQTSYAGTCEDTLEESMGVSNECLNQLELFEKRYVQSEKVESLKREITRLTFLTQYLLKNLPKYIMDFKMKNADITYDNKNRSSRDLLLSDLYRIPVHSLNVRKKPTPKSKIISVVQRDDIIPFTDVSHRILPNGSNLVWIKVGIGWIYVVDANKLEVINILSEKAQIDGSAHLLSGMKSDSKGGAKG